MDVPELVGVDQFAQEIRNWRVTDFPALLPSRHAVERRGKRPGEAVSCPRRASQASRSVSRLSMAASLGLRLSCHRHPWHTAFANGFTTSPEAPHVHLTELLEALLCSNLRLVHRAHARPAS